MSQLPPCRWRGADDGETVGCSSPMLVHARPGQTVRSTCLICPYADLSQEEIDFRTSGFRLEPEPDPSGVSSRDRGLGDTVARWLVKLRLKEPILWALRKFGVTDCGCNRRQDWLNEKFPYRYTE